MVSACCSLPTSSSSRPSMCRERQWNREGRTCVQRTSWPYLEGGFHRHKKEDYTKKKRYSRLNKKMVFKPLSIGRNPCGMFQMNNIKCSTPSSKRGGGRWRMEARKAHVLVMIVCLSTSCASPCNKSLMTLLKSLHPPKEPVILT